MSKKQILNLNELAFCEKQARRRCKFLVLAFFLLVGGTFLILLLRPVNLYVVLFDISNSMSQVMDSSDGRSKMDVAKESIMKFIETGGAKDYFVIATFGPGECQGQGLEWIEANPDKCGGEIINEISNDKLQLYDGISNIQSIEADTHLSEGLYKVFTYLEQALPGYLISKKIEVLIVGDGQDHCKAIESGKNVLLLPWSFFDKLRVSTIALQAGDGNIGTLQTLAADGNGEYVDVYAAEEFYEKVRLIFPKGPTWILYIHIALAVIFLLLFLLILKV